MLPKIKRQLKSDNAKMSKYVRNNKTKVKKWIIILVIVVLVLILLKSLFYSDSEKSIYGTRLDGLNKYRFTVDEQTKVSKKSSSLDGVKNVRVVVKGRLIKFFVTFDNKASKDDMKARFTEMLGYLSDKVKSYYDVTFYAIQKSSNKTTYPVIGYKHTKNKNVTWDEF